MNLFTLIFIDTPSEGCVKSKSCNAMELCLMECIFVISHEYSQKTANKRKLWNGQSDFFLRISKDWISFVQLEFFSEFLKKQSRSQHLMECILLEYSQEQ